ncbi:MAG: hypothetical protein LBE60_01265 [Microbacterium sp.]|jgi:hypothetical protein|uniref:hypothetical protein n=1 Tax=Microbacterium sp. TaxID=51671 RepID=UPI002835AC0C|nr:hypothetical protein [Microbacterium sp.]MDR2320259.1 hypothetical protein [Microbacterium sp.]
MVAAVSYYADASDTDALLDYLGVGTEAHLRRWFSYVSGPEGILDRETASALDPVAIISPSLGGPVLIRNRSDPALVPRTRAGLFNMMNFARRTDPSIGLIDSNVSPVLYWKPAKAVGNDLFPGEIGSQADAMSVVSPEFERWVNRVMAWVRRRGTRVWGLEEEALRPDLRIINPNVSSVYALPGALSLLEDGYIGR